MSCNEFASDDLSFILRHLTAVVDEATLLLLQQKEMTESNLSDLNQKRDREKLAKLRKDTEKIRWSLKMSKDAERRRRELEKKRKRSA